MANIQIKTIAGETVWNWVCRQYLFQIHKQHIYKLIAFLLQADMRICKYANMQICN